MNKPENESKLHCVPVGSSSPGPQNYIFGYGSLIEDESRERSTPNALYAFPALVRGLRRGWWARGAASGLTTTYLGALDDPNASCNGVIYALTDDDLAATDKRESAGYVRCQIPASSITMLGGLSRPPNGLIWAYVNTITPSQLKDDLPSPQFPIVQSYVDICLNGCLEVQNKYPTAATFLADFIATTDEWSRYWVNDRIYPRRPFIYVPNSSLIDAALQKAPKTRDLFYEIELEPASWEDRKPVRPPVPH